MAAKEKPAACTRSEGCVSFEGHPRACYFDDGEGAPSTRAQKAAEAPAEPVVPRKKGGLPTTPADWRGPHTAVILGRIERSVEGMPPAIRQEQRLILLAAFIRALDAGVTS